MAREADVVRSLAEMADTLVDDFDVVDLLTGPACGAAPGPAAGRSSLR